MATNPLFFQSTPDFGDDPLTPLQRLLGQGASQGQLLDFAKSNKLTGNESTKLSDLTGLPIESFLQDPNDFQGTVLSIDSARKPRSGLISGRDAIGGIFPSGPSGTRVRTYPDPDKFLRGITKTPNDFQGTVLPNLYGVGPVSLPTRDLNDFLARRSEFDRANQGDQLFPISPTIRPPIDRIERRPNGGLITLRGGETLQQGLDREQRDKLISSFGSGGGPGGVHLDPIGRSSRSEPSVTGGSAIEGFLNQISDLRNQLNIPRPQHSLVGSTINRNLLFPEESPGFKLGQNLITERGKTQREDLNEILERSGIGGSASGVGLGALERLNRQGDIDIGNLALESADQAQDAALAFEPLQQNNFLNELRLGLAQIELAKNRGLKREQIAALLQFQLAQGVGGLSANVLNTLIGLLTGGGGTGGSAGAGGAGGAAGGIGGIINNLSRLLQGGSATQPGQIGNLLSQIDRLLGDAGIIVPPGTPQLPLGIINDFEQLAQSLLGGDPGFDFANDPLFDDFDLDFGGDGGIFDFL